MDILSFEVLLGICAALTANILIDLTIVLRQRLRAPDYARARAWPIRPDEPPLSRRSAGRR